MKIVDFEIAKTEIKKKRPPKIDIEELELEEEDYQLAKFYSQWYDNHIAGKGKKDK